MHSPTPPPAFGASRASGGTLRGGQVKHSLSDLKTESDAPISVAGIVRLYVSSSRPDAVSIEDKPQTAVRCPAYNSFTSLLPVIAQRYPAIAGELLWVSISTQSDQVLEETSAAGRPQYLYMWDSEEGFWESLGLYQSVIEDGVDVVWKVTGDKAVAYLLLVRCLSSLSKSHSNHYCLDRLGSGC